MAISSNGRFIATGAKDRSLRFWEKTDEILVLEEEQEMVHYENSYDGFAILVATFTALMETDHLE